MLRNCFCVLKTSILYSNTIVLSKFLSSKPGLIYQYQSYFKKYLKTNGTYYTYILGQNSWQSSRNVHIVEMRGLDYEATEQDVIDYFKPLNITPSKVRLKCDISGRTSGVCEVEFATHGDAVISMRKKNAFMGHKFIRLNLKSENNESEEDLIRSTLNKNDDVTPRRHFIRMRNLPPRMTEQAIFEFFWPLNTKPVAVESVYDENGFHTGEFDVEFLNYEDTVKAMSKNNSFIGHRSIELILHSKIDHDTKTPIYSETIEYKEAHK